MTLQYVIDFSAVCTGKHGRRGAPLWNAPHVLQSYFLSVDVDPSCSTRRRPRVAGQNAEHYVSVNSLLHYYYFPVITSVIQLRKSIP